MRGTDSDNLVEGRVRRLITPASIILTELAPVTRSLDLRLLPSE